MIANKKSMPDKYDIAVCIPTCNRPNDLAALLENLKEQSVASMQVIIADASSGNLTIKVADNISELDITYIKCRKGLTHQRNIAIDHVRSDFTLMLDDDVVLEKNCISNLLNGLKSNPGYGALSAYIVNEYNKRPYRHHRLYHRLGVYETLEPGRWLKCGDFLQLSTLKPFSGIYRSDFLPAGVTLFRTSVIREIRPDSDFGFTAEDKEWTLRIGKKYRLGVCGDAKVFHNNKSRKRNPFSITKDKQINYYRLLKKHRKAGKSFFFSFQLLDFSRIMLSAVLMLKFRNFVQATGLLSGWLYNCNTLIRKGT